MADHENIVKQRLNLPLNRSNLLLFFSRVGVWTLSKHCYGKKQRLNNRYSWFKHWLDDDFHKRCLNLVEITGPLWLAVPTKLISPNIQCNNVIQKIIEARSICLFDSKKTKDVSFTSVASCAE